MRRARRRRAHAGREVDHVGGVGRPQLAGAQVDDVAGRAEQQRVDVPGGVVARQPAVGARRALDRRRGADLAELVLADQGAHAVEHVLVAVAPPDRVVPAQPLAAGVVEDEMAVVALGEFERQRVLAHRRDRRACRLCRCAGSAWLRVGLPRLGLPGGALVVDLAQDHVDVPGNIVAAACRDISAQCPVG